jgi:hypothetical protein
VRVGLFVSGRLSGGERPTGADSGAMASDAPGHLPDKTLDPGFEQQETARFRALLVDPNIVLANSAAARTPGAVFIPTRAADLRPREGRGEDDGREEGLSEGERATARIGLVRIPSGRGRASVGMGGRSSSVGLGGGAVERARAAAEERRRERHARMSAPFGQAVDEEDEGPLLRDLTDPEGARLRSGGPLLSGQRESSGRRTSVTAFLMGGPLRDVAAQALMRDETQHESSHPADSKSGDPSSPRSVQKEWASLQRHVFKSQHSSAEEPTTSSVERFRERRRRWKVRNRFADVVLEAIERDRTRCASAALLCPCYLCAGPKVRTNILWFQTSWGWGLLNVLLTVFLLMANELLKAALPKQVDPYFWGVYVFACVVFLADCAFGAMLDRRSVCTFFGWLDVISAVVVLVDVGPVEQAIIASVGDASATATINRAISAGSQVGRILRLLRLVRIVRFRRVTQWWRMVVKFGCLAIVGPTLYACCSRHWLLRWLVCKPCRARRVTPAESRRNSVPADVVVTRVPFQDQHSEPKEAAVEKVNEPTLPNGRRRRRSVDELLVQVAEAKRAPSFEEHLPRPGRRASLESVERYEDAQTNNWRMKVEQDKLEDLWADVRGTSRVGRKIAGNVKRQVIVGVIAVVILLPLLNFEPPNDQHNAEALAIAEGMTVTMVQSTIARAAQSGGPSSLAGGLELSANGSLALAAATAAQFITVTRLTQLRTNTMLGVLRGGKVGLLVRGANQSDATGPVPLSLLESLTPLSVTETDVLDRPEWLSSAEVFRIDAKALRRLRPESVTVHRTPRGSVMVLDASAENRMRNLFQFFQTQLIVAIMGVLATALQGDVDRLLVYPIEKISAFLRPVMDEAIEALTKPQGGGRGGVIEDERDQWRQTLGQDDGEEISTKLMLAAIEVLRRDLSSEARRNWVRKAVMSQFQSADKTVRTIKGTMNSLARGGLLNEGGGLRFQPEQQAEGGRNRTSVVPYSGLEAVKEARPVEAMRVSEENGEDDDDDEEEEEDEPDAEGEELLASMLAGMSATRPAETTWGDEDDE